MARSAEERVRLPRRWSTTMIAAACVAVGALVATLVLPEHYANAATTGVSTIYKTATNTRTGSVAASSDAPGGAKTGTARPNDLLKWVVNYQNNTTANASVNLKDVISTAGTYVPGSLQLPPNQNAAGTFSAQYSTNGGTSWVTGTPPSNANGVGFTGTAVPQGTRQLSVAIPSPVSTVLTTSGGDGYNAVTRGSLTYAAFHHGNGNIVFCAQQDGSTCPGWPTDRNAQYWSSVVGTPIGTGTSASMITAWQNGTWISGSKLYWFMGAFDNSSTGTACLDLSTTTPTSCGYKVLTSNPVSNSEWAHIGSSGIPASNGNIYAVATSCAV
ncbi:MAG: hypothetical protein JF618_00885, partial [Leifsonia sp.]|nr:hypothetical protein [Leifsonia sp.]